MVSGALDTLKQEFADCATLAFADVSTKMVLVTDTTSNQPREAIDRLCAEAAVLLGQDGRAALGEGAATMAMATHGDRLHIFLRASNDPTDILCCNCSAQIPVVDFLNAARNTLEQISN